MINLEKKIFLRGPAPAPYSHLLFKNFSDSPPSGRSDQNLLPL